MKTLVVEDDRTSRLVLGTVMSGFGQCDAVEDGIVGLRKFQDAVATENRYDLVCLDIMMPGIDGREVLREIRATEEFLGLKSAQAVKIIMTTALSGMQMIVESFNSLCDGYLVKPIDRAKLVGYLNQFGLVEDGSRKSAA